MSTQKGGFYPGMILGFLLGVAVAVGVTLYVTKAPVPFINKVPQRSAEYDAAEAQRNRNWDPNAPLQGRSTTRPAAPAAPQQVPPPAPSQQQSQTPPVSPYYPDTPPPSPAEAPVARMPADPPALRAPAVQGGSAATRPAERPAERSAGTSGTRDPAALLADRPATAATASYFVQTGAFARVEDAEQQRARLAMMGLSARITEREQTGRVVYRVRVGPFDARDDAESARERVAGNGLEAALVSVQR